MSNQEAAIKVKEALQSIWESLAVNGAQPLAKVLRSYNLSGDYAKILVDHGAVIKTQGGARGRAVYKPGKATMATCLKMVKECNVIRAEAAKRYYKNRSPRVSVDYMSQVSSQLQTIMLTLNQIQDEIKKIRG